MWSHFVYCTSHMWFCLCYYDVHLIYHSSINTIYTKNIWMLMIWENEMVCVWIDYYDVHIYTVYAVYYILKNAGHSFIICYRVTRRWQWFRICNLVHVKCDFVVNYPLLPWDTILFEEFKPVKCAYSFNLHNKENIFRSKLTEILISAPIMGEYLKIMCHVCA